MYSEKISITVFFVRHRNKMFVQGSMSSRTFLKLIVCHWQKCAENLYSAFLDAKTRDFTCVYTIAFQTSWVFKSFIFSHRVILKNELTRKGMCIVHVTIVVTLFSFSAY